MPEHIEQQIRQQLFALQDPQYKQFHCRLIPTVNPELVIGVRTPALRGFARELAKTEQARQYRALLPHRYYDENNLHGFLIEHIKNYDEAIAAMEAFLPYIDNWATCDLVCPKVFGRHLPDLYNRILAWVASGHTYTVRFGIGMLLRFYLDDAFLPEHLTLAAGLRTEEYYVNMMVAWYVATALAKQYDAALALLQSNRLPDWTHNKAIQKAIESRRIPDDRKAVLRALTIKRPGRGAAAF